MSIIIIKTNHIQLNTLKQVGKCDKFKQFLYTTIKYVNFYI